MTTPSLWIQSADQLLSATASHQPTPGGGSIAALSGAFGTGLVAMALSISERKAHKKGGKLSACAQQGTAQLSEQQAQLKALADADVSVFAQYIAAAKLPKDTSEQQQTRQHALAQAGAAARQTPLAIAQVCVQALQTAQAILADIDKGVVSDVGAGAALLRGAADAALLTLDINVLHLKGEEQAHWQAQRRALAQQAADLSGQLLAQVGEKIRG